MLTQFKTTEPQALLLAACPRPRALARLSATPVFASPVTAMSAPAVSPAWPDFAPILDAAFTRVPAFGAVAGLAEYATVLRPMAGVRPDSAVRGNGGGIVRPGNENGTSSSEKQHDQQHLTTRRGPVTWRPPH